jgi:hypothetical protein
MHMELHLITLLWFMDRDTNQDAIQTQNAININFYIIFSTLYFILLTHNHQIVNHFFSFPLVSGLP